QGFAGVMVRNVLTAGRGLPGNLHLLFLKISQVIVDGTAPMPIDSERARNRLYLTDVTLPSRLLLPKASSTIRRDNVQTPFLAPSWRAPTLACARRKGSSPRDLCRTSTSTWPI